jgi:hypothetical protein
MKNKTIQKSLFVGITVALFIGVVFVSNANFVLSQNISDSGNPDLGVTGNNTSASNSSSSDTEGYWTDRNSTLTVTQ